jgi:hypothetical protein
MFSKRGHIFGMVSLLVVGLAQPAVGQTKPWLWFDDSPVSSSDCDLVNAADAELVVLTDTGQLVIVTGPDIILEDSYVDSSLRVFLGNDQVGFIDYALDGDGYRTVWWVSLTGHVIDIDGLTGIARETDLFPSDFTRVPCDACDFWDDQTVCPPRFTLCGAGGASSVAMIVVGLGIMGLVRRRQG